jgi:GGDEF domain-containing protein
MLHGLQGRWKTDRTLKGCFIVADLDGLHNINRRFGKLLGGNDYLRDVSKSLIKVAREEGGRCFRNGKQADEFTLYLPGYIQAAKAGSVLDKLDFYLEEYQSLVQEKHHGIKYGLSYCVSSINPETSPIIAFENAENEIDKAKTPKADGLRVGNVGRLFINVK